MRKRPNRQANCQLYALISIYVFSIHLQVCKLALIGIHSWTHKWFVQLVMIWVLLSKNDLLRTWSHFWQAFFFYSDLFPRSRQNTRTPNAYPTAVSQNRNKKREWLRDPPATRQNLEARTRKVKKMKKKKRLAGERREIAAGSARTKIVYKRQAPSAW